MKDCEVPEEDVSRPRQLADKVREDEEGVRRFKEDGLVGTEAAEG